jgi:hypothetical protein
METFLTSKETSFSLASPSRRRDRGNTETMLDGWSVSDDRPLYAKLQTPRSANFISRQFRYWITNYPQANAPTGATYDT